MPRPPPQLIPPPPALLASWPSPRCGRHRGPASCRVSAPLHPRRRVFSFEERVIVPSQPCPSPAGRAPSPSWARGHPFPAGPSVLAGTSWGRGSWAVRALSAKHRAGGRACPVMSQLSGWAECGLGWAEASDPGRGAAHGDIGAGTPLLRAFGANITAKLSVWAGRPRTQPCTRQEHVCTHGRPRLVQGGWQALSWFIAPTVQISLKFFSQ